MKELYTNLKKLNLNVSVDITKYSKSSSLYSLCYDRPILAKFSDYLILMGYDEHVSSSKDPGSVGSYSWVDGAIKDIINQGVPASKLVLAVPFYLRDYSVIAYDAVIFDKVGKIYNVPVLSDSNKLIDGKKDNYFKCLSSDGNWYVIDYNGTTGYIAKNNVRFLAKSYEASTTNGAITITSDSSIVITSGGGINSVPNGSGAIVLNLPYDVVIIKNDCSIYKSKYDISTNKVLDVGVNGYFKYIGTLGAWFQVDYKGKTCYVSNTQASFIKADTRALSGSSVSMSGALDRITQNGGSIFDDSTSRQKVGVYFVDGIEHKIWLETNDSMQWRMDLVNNYHLAGAAVWSLYWKPTEGIWNVIKSNLEN